MKAIVIDRFGDAQELHEAEIPIPSIDSDEVLVKMMATSVNPIDWRTRNGTRAGWGFPLAGTIAYQVIVQQLAVGKGDKVLVQGGAGGVGLFAIQIAKARGAYVATTASAETHTLLHSLGADEVIDYHETKYTDVLHDYDGVFDTMDDIDNGLKILKPTGQLISIAGQPSFAQQGGHPSARHWRMHPNGQDTAEVAELVATDKVKVIIDSEYPLTTEGLRAAHLRSESHHAHGKIVITIADPPVK